MATAHESALTDQLVELQAWYVDSFRPKLARAATSGAVEAAAADVLDRRLRELLDLHDDLGEEAA
jgi:hypothetical protein